ncbi:SHOCT domain-containing protein [Nocardioides terrigena]|uniref:SHOCT domain-containing protein n=1 Tax=Nocardioides terrigena TaxID=424797 RepID=UPI000D307F0D|nr:SHOCT domain-containing protein [Nocardioides terrigena]
MTTRATDLTLLAEENFPADLMLPAGVPDLFLLFFFLVLVTGVAGVVWRIQAARSMARRAGLDEGEAVRMALTSEDGLTATYLASSLRGPSAGAPGHDHVVRDTATRLRELDRLLSEGLITQDEHTSRRAGILDEV